jgi:hypothetical protein
MIVSMPVSPGIFERWVAPGALVAGCGALAWFLARAAMMSAQPALLAAAVPFGAAGAVLGNIVHQEGSQVWPLANIPHLRTVLKIPAALSVCEREYTLEE